MDDQDTLERIHTALKPIIGEGKVACDGTVFSVGDATKRFSIQCRRVRIKMRTTVALVLQLIFRSKGAHSGAHPTTCG